VRGGDLPSHPGQLTGIGTGAALQGSGERF